MENFQAALEIFQIHRIHQSASTTAELDSQSGVIIIKQLMEYAREARVVSIRLAQMFLPVDVHYFQMEQPLLRL